MKNLKNSEIYQTVGGMGWYPGYNADDHRRATDILAGVTVGFFVGLVEGAWNAAADFAS